MGLITGSKWPETNNFLLKLISLFLFWEIKAIPCENLPEEERLCIKKRHAAANMSTHTYTHTHTEQNVFWRSSILWEIDISPDGSMLWRRWVADTGDMIRTLNLYRGAKYKCYILKANYGWMRSAMCKLGVKLRATAELSLLYSILWVFLNWLVTSQPAGVTSILRS